MAAKQIAGSKAPDGSEYVTLTDGAGNLSTVTLAAGDLEIGAVELKDGTTDNRVSISAAGALKVDGSAVTQPVSVAATLTTASVGPATGTITSVASSATDVTVLASNASRKSAAVYNDSTQILYLALSNTTSSATVYTTQIAAGGYYELPVGRDGVYTGVLKGIWASANGNARVTELA